MTTCMMKISTICGDGYGGFLFMWWGKRHIDILVSITIYSFILSGKGLHGNQYHNWVKSSNVKIIHFYIIRFEPTLLH